MNNMGFFKRIIAVLFCFSFCLFLSSCGALEKPYQKTDFIMDTFVEYKFFGKKAKEAADEISSSLRKLEEDFSSHKESSYVSKINASSGLMPVSVTKEACEVLEKSKEISLMTSSNYNALIGAVTRLWNVTGDEPYVPSEFEKNRAKELCDINDLIIDSENKTVFLKECGEAIDLGGILKGYAAQKVFEICKDYGIKNGYASIGGNLAVFGTDENGKDYRFGIRDPKGTENQYIGSLSLTGKTMSTAGGYERFFELDGEKYIHIFDSKTAEPAKSDFLSVTAIGEDGSLCDALATAVFVGGYGLLEELDEEKGASFVTVDKDGKIFVSESLKENFQLNEKNENGYTLFEG